MTDQANPEPAIDPREVAQLTREIRTRYLATDEGYFPTTFTEAALYWSNARQQAEWMLRAEQTYLAEHGIPSAEDPRDAEIRQLKREISALHAAWARVARESDRWHERALAAESKPVEAPKPAEPTRTERLVRFVREAEELGLEPVTLSTPKGVLLSVRDPQLDPAEAAAVHAALEERADGS